jgi:hypothetical protein
MADIRTDNTLWDIIIEFGYKYSDIKQEHNMQASMCILKKISES